MVQAALLAPAAWEGEVPEVWGQQAQAPLQVHRALPLAVLRWMEDLLQPVPLLRWGGGASRGTTGSVGGAAPSGGTGIRGAPGGDRGAADTSGATGVPGGLGRPAGR